MYRTISDFLEDWKEESAMTIKIFQAVDESKKAEKLNDNVRSLEKLAWHLTQTLAEMPLKAGLIAEDPLEHQPIPSSFSSVIDTYEQYAATVANAVKEQWKDENLHEEVNMYGESWKKGKILSVLVKHQAHHRAQMTVIMRALGMQVPGIYGPSKEEWVKYGMTPMD